MVLLGMFGERFQILMVSSDEHVTKEPAGSTGLTPRSSSGGGTTTSRPQMVEEWNRKEWLFPTWK